ncbi:MAG: S8 family peptidase [Acutalibacteraceae bacterium]
MKNVLRTVVALALVFALCAVVLEPSAVKTLVTTAENTRQTEANLQWKQDAVQNGADIYSFEDTLFFAQTDERDIVCLTDGIGYVRNEILVSFEDGTSVAQKQNLFDRFGAAVIGCADVINQYQLRIEARSFAKLQLLCTSLRREKNVAFASCHIALRRTEDFVYDDPWTDPVTGETTAPQWDEPSILSESGNWWLTATQTPAAWEYSKYFQHIRIGILDSGFETQHEDLQGKISFPGKKYERTNIPSSHGTHVAGIISAIGGNQKGIAGICQNADILAVDWNPESGQLWSTDMRIFTGFIALVKAGAKVINLSLGSSGGYEKKKDFFWKRAMFWEGVIFSYMMASLLHKGYDFIAVQSAGNGMHSGEPCDAKYNGTFCSISKRNIFTGLTGISKQEILDRILVVGSSTYFREENNFYMSSFSNYGDTVSIFAPGSRVFSTDLSENGGYSFKSGTSMAAPVVTAIAALTWSVNPSLTGSQVKKILCDPQNTIYTCVNYFYLPEEDSPGIEIPDCPMVNAKLCVEAAIETLSLPEESTEPLQTTDAVQSETQPVTISPPSFSFTLPNTVAANGESTAVHSDWDREQIEKFRGEIGE